MIEETMQDATPEPRGSFLALARNSDIKPARACREWIDNSLDAKGRDVRISGDTGKTLIIEDDGRGCSDPLSMVKLGSSHAHDSDPRAGYFGMGAKLGDLRYSQATMTTIDTVHEGVLYHVIADWKQMMESNSYLIPVKKITPAPAGRIGTRIVNHNFPGFRGWKGIIEQLGFDYADALRDGVSLTFKINGETIRVQPYEQPEFTHRMNFTLQYGEWLIPHYCAVVAPDIANPYHGWTVHWGPRRILCTTSAPANGRYTGRLHGHIFLPFDWPNFNPTKDGFNWDPDDLFEAIGAQCTPIIKLAEAAATRHNLNIFTSHLQNVLNAKLPREIKGRREKPEVPKPGTVLPSHNGPPHRKFTKEQPGDKGRSKNKGRLPHSYEVYWDPTLNRPWKIEIAGQSNVVAQLTLNQAHEEIHGYLKRDEPEGLATWCMTILAAHLSVNPDQQRFLPLNGEQKEELDMLELFEQFTRGPKALVEAAS